jgi:predicted TIM-barrel fold metal-dependent hydrolase
MPVVDTHAHVFTRNLPFVDGATHVFDRDYTGDDFVAELDRASIPFGVIAAASFLGTNCDYTLSVLRAHHRLRATVIVEPDTSLDRLLELDRAGVVGIRLATGNLKAPPDLETPAYRGLLAKLVDLDWHVHVFGRPEHLPPMLTSLGRAGVKIVVDHFGARDPNAGLQSPSFQAILSVLRNGRTWVKLSGPYLSEGLDHRALAERLLEEGGAERLLWGSDWPFVKLGGRLDYTQTVKWLSDWIPDTAVQQQIDSNAKELYRFPRLLQ